MALTHKEIWTAFHGMGLGAGFLLLFSAGFVSIWSLGAEGLGSVAVKRRVTRLAAGAWVMALLVWATVLLGTYMIYPWYRAKPPAGTKGVALADFPKYRLTWDPATGKEPNHQTEEWHEFGMEWKEHIAWLAPILLTAVASILTFGGSVVAREAGLRRMVLFLFTVAFVCAFVAGAMGALINKAAPTR